MGFSRQEYWSGLPFPFPGDLPYPGIKPRSSALQTDALPSEPCRIFNCSMQAKSCLLPALVAQMLKASACNAEDLGLIPGSGRSAGEGIGYPLWCSWASFVAGKESACNAEDLGLILGLGRSPRERKGYPLQYSGLDWSPQTTWEEKYGRTW